MLSSNGSRQVVQLLVDYCGVLGVVPGLRPNSGVWEGRTKHLFRHAMATLVLENGGGEGHFELRGKEVRIFYISLLGRVALLLDGEIEKRNDIPTATMKRMRKLQKDALAGYGRRHRPRR